MMRKYNFISGLPRSGTTLLSSILKQNPRFTAGISDVIQGYVNSIIESTNHSVGVNTTISVEKQRELIRGIFDNFYIDGNEVCFNTNRGWSASTSLLKDLYPDFRMIICVREIPWILDSFEQLNSKNPYTIKALYHHQANLSVYERTQMLMGDLPNFAGYVAGPLANVKQSLFCNERNQICYVEYDDLVKNPLIIMKKIYNFLEEPWFDHDFDNVEDSYDEFDQAAKIEGLHRVRKQVEFKQRRPILPNDLWHRYSSSSFWKDGFDDLKKQINWITSDDININVKQRSDTFKQIPRSNKQL
jgi:sulfotransferase